MVTPQVLTTVADFPLRLVPAVASGGWDPVPAPAPIAVRVDPDGELWLTDGHTTCGGGTRVEIPAGGLRDFAVGRGYGLLYADGLHWSSGWRRDGDFGRVLADADRLYVTERHGPAVFELSPATGELVRTLVRSPDAGPPFLAGGLICAVFTDIEAGVRGIETVAPDGTISRSPLPHYAAMIPTVGFDKNIRGYAVSDGVIARFSRSGGLDERGPVPADLPPASLHVDPDGRVLYATAGGDGVTVFALPG